MCLLYRGNVEKRIFVNWWNRRDSCTQELNFPDEWNLHLRNNFYHSNKDLAPSHWNRCLKRISFTTAMFWSINEFHFFRHILLLGVFTFAVSKGVSSWLALYLCQSLPRFIRIPHLSLSNWLRIGPINRTCLPVCLRHRFAHLMEHIWISRRFFPNSR